MAEQIEVLFGVETLGGPRHIVFNGGSELLIVEEGK